MNLGRALRVLRAARDLTGAGLAQLSRVHPSVVTRTEQGIRTRLSDDLPRLAVSLGAPVALLAMLSADAPPDPAVLGAALIPILWPSPKEPS